MKNNKITSSPPLTSNGHKVVWKGLLLKIKTRTRNLRFLFSRANITSGSEHQVFFYFGDIFLGRTIKLWHRNPSTEVGKERKPKGKLP